MSSAVWRCRAHQEVIEKKGRETDIDRKKKAEFLKGIQKQIHEKQETRIQEHRAKYEEGIKLDDEARQRRLMLDDVKQRKFNELKSAIYSVSLSVSVSVLYVLNACPCWPVER